VIRRVLPLGRASRDWPDRAADEHDELAALWLTELHAAALA